MKKYFPLCLLLIPLSVSAQSGYAWHEPSFVEGLCEPDTSNIYHRLPARLQNEVREPVWNLSLNTAGEFIHFKTSARSITVRYVLANKHFSLPHMPETGVSGADLYALDKNGQWNWAPAHYSIGDTCQYIYKSLKLDVNKKWGDFYLYLPLYNTVTWLTIGVPAGESFSFNSVEKGKPIVAYGTSILQGAVASRPGLAWTNILERRLDRTVINLGFSGNGRFEKPIFDLMTKTDAALYILDCMPNLTRGYRISDEEIKDRVYYGVKKLREDHPGVPILFTEHAVGFGPYYMDTSRLNDYHESSILIAKIFSDLEADGIRNIYLLTDKEIGFDINSTTEGLHPDDIGMMQYAAAYEKKIREILHEPAGNISTEMPVEQYRDGYDWVKRHNEIIENIKQTSPDVLLIGNSIINYWGGLPAAESGIARGEDSWQKYMAPLKVQNAGFGWDRVENVLWRVYHDELDDFKGKKIILMIGTNNLGGDKDEDIVNGLQFLLEQIRYRQPNAEIIMAGILPRKGGEDHVAAINRQIKKMAGDHHFRYVGFGKDFLEGSKINPALFVGDGLHPNRQGYEVMGRDLARLIR